MNFERCRRPPGHSAGRSKPTSAPTCAGGRRKGRPQPSPAGTATDLDERSFPAAGDDDDDDEDQESRGFLRAPSASITFVSWLISESGGAPRRWGAELSGRGGGGGSGRGRAATRSPLKMSAENQLASPRSAERRRLRPERRPPRRPSRERRDQPLD